MKSQDKLKVFISSRSATCDECAEDLGRGAWITLAENHKAFCLACADLDHLVFLPSGDAALTRRSGKYSTLSAVVLKWSKARKRYERQGLLVENNALKRAESECLADAEARSRHRIREALRREEQDRVYITRFAESIRQFYPRCPQKSAKAIATHACLKYSGRIGRTAAAKTFDEEAVRLAVMAHIRHAETKYDSLLMQGWDRYEAREEVRDQIQTVLEHWKGENGF